MRVDKNPLLKGQVYSIKTMMLGCIMLVLKEQHDVLLYAHLQGAQVCRVNYNQMAFHGSKDSG